MSYQEVGGYFELELPCGEANIHPRAFALNSGRTSLRIILKSTRAKKIYLPFYICDSVIEVMERSGVDYEFCPLNNDLELANVPEVKDGELMLYVNYFDLKRTYVQYLSNLLGERLVIDNSHAFFCNAYSNSWSFNSARKFFGVPDGSYLYPPGGIDILSLMPEDNYKNYVFAHLIHRFEGRTQEGYRFYTDNESSIGIEEKLMSKLTRAILSNIDYEKAALARRQNYFFYRDKLARINRISAELDNDAVPFCYPLLNDGLAGHQQLWPNGIFVPVLWVDCLRRRLEGYEFEKRLSQYLLPLPVDHRYDPHALDRVIDKLL